MEFVRPRINKRATEAYRKRRGDDDEDRPPKHRGLKREAEEENRKKLQAMLRLIRELRNRGLVDDMIWIILQYGYSADIDMIRHAFRVANL
jgi:hypothetical protein